MANMQTEIRKLSSAETYGLVKILNDSNSWIDLMQIIPNESGNLFKYNTDHIRLIQNEASDKKSCAEILLDEWGTSGRKRPTLKFLLDLLLKANLFRAADYILVDILKGVPAPRPSEGPAAKIDTSMHMGNSLETIQENKFLAEKVCTKNISQSSNLEPDILSAIQQDCIPDFAVLLSTSQKSGHLSDIEPEITNSAVSSYAPSSGYIPDLAALDIIPYSTQNSTENMRSDKQDCSSENLNVIVKDPQYATSAFRLPNLSELNINRSFLENSTSDVMPIVDSNINSEINCYPYKLLEMHTNNFNDALYGQPGGCRLGSGAFGTIYLGQDLSVRPLAVKRLHKIDSENINLFKNEIEIMSNHRHKNLLKLFGYSVDGPTYCLIYEYMPGGSLQDRLKMDDNKLCGGSRINIAIGCAEGIFYLHNIPIIHRDVKSANILLDERNQPKLSDFGLIKKTNSALCSAQTTTILGTSAYMSPEAHRGDISEKMDCYSFGVVLLELITGLPPLDEHREGCDIVTHIEQYCDSGVEGIDKLIDERPGPWLMTAREMYKVALACLREKRNRPIMQEILESLKSVNM